MTCHYAEERFRRSVSGIMLSSRHLERRGIDRDGDLADKALAGIVFNVLLIARAPLQLFQAIQTSLRPIDGARGDGRPPAFARAIRLTVLAIARVRRGGGTRAVGDRPVRDEPPVRTALPLRPVWAGADRGGHGAAPDLGGPSTRPPWPAIAREPRPLLGAGRGGFLVWMVIPAVRISYCVPRSATRERPRWLLLTTRATPNGRGAARWLGRDESDGDGTAGLDRARDRQVRARRDPPPRRSPTRPDEHVRSRLPAAGRGLMARCPVDLEASRPRRSREPARSSAGERSMNCCPPQPGFTVMHRPCPAAGDSASAPTGVAGLIATPTPTPPSRIRSAV